MKKPETDALRLVPCPFCGADPGVSKYDVDDETTKWAAGCDGSGAPESWVYVEHYVNVHGDTKADVISAWNRRAAPASPLPGGGWQDISTAPKDGTPILITRPTRFMSEEGYHVVRWEDDRWCCHDGKFDTWLRGSDPTHWMPLPAAPTGDA